ncbi:MAG: type II secretion system protein [Candidatus Sericytochromatia bacterium]|nr:type II secretion system protein [Candidatus Sericytochromatia bacterium]
MTDTRLSARSGLTLVEILLAAALISVLVAISARGLNGAKDRSNNGQAESNVRQVELGLQAYHADYDKYPTFISRNTSNEREDPEVLLNPLLNRNYVKGDRLPPCPWRPQVYQINDLAPTFDSNTIGVWTLATARSLTRPVAVPLAPASWGRGAAPTSGTGGQTFTANATNVTYGAILYQANRSQFVLYGAGKRGSAGLVVAIGTNIR